MKRCTVCKHDKPLSEFYANRRSADGKGYRCKTCDDAARTKSRAKSEGTKLGYRRRMLQASYGLSLEDYEAMLDAQEGVCAICKSDNPAGEGNFPKKALSFSVDHCHSTGKVRGLLCNTCNRGLGFFKDDMALLVSAQEYLSCH